MNFSQDFLKKTALVAETLDVNGIEKMAVHLAQVREHGGRGFFVGSGGGAGHASHAVCDFRKLAGIQAICPTDNVSEHRSPKASNAAASVRAMPFLFFPLAAATSRKISLPTLSMPFAPPSPSVPKSSA